MRQKREAVSEVDDKCINPRCDAEDFLLAMLATMLSASIWEPDVSQLSKELLAKKNGKKTTKVAHAHDLWKSITEKTMEEESK